MSAATMQLALGMCPPEDLEATQRLSPEAALIQAAKGGDSAAFGRLVERYQRPLLRYLCRLVRRQDVGQDLCQETLLRAWRRLGDFDLVRPLAPWLYRIATNLALNFLQRSSWRFLPLLLGRAGTGEEQDLDVPSEEETADEQMLRAEDIQAVQAALERLEPSHRAPLLLYYGEELSCKELAEALEITEPAAKVRLHRARARLRAVMESGERR